MPNLSTVLKIIAAIYFVSAAIILGNKNLRTKFRTSLK